MTAYVLTYGIDSKNDLEIMDGDRRKVEPFEEGFQWRNGRDYALHPDGLIVHRYEIASGLRINPKHLAKNILWKISDKLEDFHFYWNTPIVSERIRLIVEKFEPAQHQFEEVSFVEKNGNIAAQYYWFFPLKRIDSMDRERTSHELVNDGRNWKFVPGNEFTISQSQVDGHFIWRDPRVGGDYVFISQSCKNAMEEASITGTRYLPYKTA